MIRYRMVKWANGPKFVTRDGEEFVSNYASFGPWMPVPAANMQECVDYMRANECKVEQFGPARFFQVSEPNSSKSAVIEFEEAA